MTVPALQVLCRQRGSVALFAAVAPALIAALVLASGTSVVVMKLTELESRCVAGLTELQNYQLKLHKKIFLMNSQALALQKQRAVADAAVLRTVGFPQAHAVARARQVMVISKQLAFKEKQNAHVKIALETSDRQLNHLKTTLQRMEAKVVAVRGPTDTFLRRPPASLSPTLQYAPNTETLQFAALNWIWTPEIFVRIPLFRDRLHNLEIKGRCGVSLAQRRQQWIPAISEGRS